jgi:hypothetical protein
VDVATFRSRLPEERRWKLTRFIKSLSGIRRERSAS